MHTKLLGKSVVLSFLNFMVFFIFPTKTNQSVEFYFLELKMSSVRHIYSQCVDSDANTREYSPSIHLSNASYMH
jgi:hypothetical protein